MSKQKIVKVIAYFLAIFTLLLNIINISYAVNYYSKYNESNVKIINDFNTLHQGKNTEEEFNKLCSDIRPANFKEVYYSLSNWSGIMILVLAIAIMGYLVYLCIFLYIKKEKRGEKIDFKNTGVILLLSFILSLVFYWFSLDTDYDILYCLLPYIK